MSIFLKSIRVNRIFHLHDFSVDIDNDNKMHLIITGKNGSGKTSLLLAIAEFFQTIKNEPSLSFLDSEKNIRLFTTELNALKGGSDLSQINMFENALRTAQDTMLNVFGKVTLDFNDIFRLAKEIRDNNFLLAYYGANRKASIVVPLNPEKPNLQPESDIKKTKMSEFLKFLVDLKVQEALARNENQFKEADEIKMWFKNFTELLQELFEEDNVKLNFHYKDYSFKIIQGDREFGFNHLSDGYSAILDIIGDLIIKMQKQNILKNIYEIEGIVLIDEIETHLHLKLQRLVLPMLTKVFPNIQFIMTTHSPFVLNSISNAVAFDLEKCVRLENLTEYSYEALAEGYFNVDIDSSFLTNKLDRFKELSQVSDKDTAELAEYESLDNEFKSMDELLTPPNIKGQYLQIKLGAK